MGRVAQSSGASKQRLAEISHHFLSEPREGEGKPAGRKARPALLPVLPVPGAADFPFARLTQAFLARGWPTAILDPRRGVRDVHTHPIPSAPSHPEPSAPPVPADGGGGPANPAQVVDAARALKPAPRLCLVPLSVEDWPLPADFLAPLLAVPAGADGVREAYRCLKRIAAAGPLGPVGAVMVQAPDEETAGRHFDKLADGAMRFLGVQVVSFGYLPAPPDPHAAVDLLADAPDAAFGAALEGVVRLIEADLAPAPDPAPVG
jgi:hypothetical protein